jgi:hypothetical protein
MNTNCRCKLVYREPRQQVEKPFHVPAIKPMDETELNALWGEFWQALEGEPFTLDFDWKVGKADGDYE